MFFLFDFDGVLIDSAPETAYTAYNAFSGDTVTESAELPEHFERLFLIHRPLVGPAGEFYHLAELVLEQLNASSPQTIRREDLTSRLARSILTERERQTLFFEARGRFQKLDIDRWYDLHAPFQPLWRALQNGRFPRFAILTNKNCEAVLSLARHFSLSLTANQVFSGDGTKTKAENLSELNQREPGESFLFLDDQLRNIEELQVKFPERLTGVLADWGYRSEGDLECAQARGIPIMNQEEFIRVYG